LRRRGAPRRAVVAPTRLLRSHVLNRTVTRRASSGNVPSCARRARPFRRADTRIVNCRPIKMTVIPMYAR
jgi:hypothetical protein